MLRVEISAETITYPPEGHGLGHTGYDVSIDEQCRNIALGLRELADKLEADGQAALGNYTSRIWEASIRNEKMADR